MRKDDAAGGEPVVLSRAALAQAFDEHAAALLRYCERRCDDPWAAEDSLSIVFLEAWRSRQRAFMLESSMAPWLYGIAANVLRTERRSRRRYRAALERFHSGEASSEGSADHADLAASAADAPRVRLALDEAFAQLSRKDREVAELCLTQGLSAAAAAAALGLPEGTVKSRLAHARSVLRLQLLQTGEVEPQADPGGSRGHVEGECAPRARVPKAATSRTRT